MKELITALAKAKQEFEPIVNDKANAYAKFRYASLGGMLEATTPALCRNGLVLYFTLDNDMVTGVLCHVSGESIQTSVSLAKIEEANKANEKEALKMQPMQKLATVITGLKRYILMALLGVAGEDPDEENTIDAKTQEWILTYIEDLEIDKNVASSILYKSTGVKTRKDIPLEKLINYLTALRNEKNKTKPESKPEPRPEPRPTVAKNPENPGGSPGVPTDNRLPI